MPALLTHRDRCAEVGHVPWCWCLCLCWCWCWWHQSPFTPCGVPGSWLHQFLHSCALCCLPGTPITVHTLRCSRFLMHPDEADHRSRLAAFPVPGSAISSYKPPLSHAGIAALELITSIVTLALHMWSNRNNARCHCPPFSHAEIAAGAGACAGAGAGAGAGGTSHRSRLAAFPVPGATML